MPKIVSKSHGPYMLKTMPEKQKTKKTLGEYRCRTGFHNSRMSELGELCVLWVVRVLGFLQQHGLTFVSWLRRSFPVEKIFFASHILRDHFLIGLSRLELNVGHKIFPHMPMHGGQVKSHQLRQGFAYPLQLPSVNFISRPYILVVLFRCFVVRTVESLALSGTVDFILSLLGHERPSEANEFTKTIALA